jgi:hypothetical protein
MIIYNVTVKINTEVQEDWLQWMRTIHIPDVMNTGKFTSNQIAKVLGQDESDGITYAIQYTCKDMKTLHQYTVNDSPSLQKEHNSRYQGKYVAYRTLLEIID